MGQLRKKARHLSERVRQGDTDAASALLDHSIELGHAKLTLHRFFLAHAMGARIDTDQIRHCAPLLRGMSREVAEDIAAVQARNAKLYLGRSAKSGVQHA